MGSCWRTTKHRFEQSPKSIICVQCHRCLFARKWPLKCDQSSIKFDFQFHDIVEVRLLEMTLLGRACPSKPVLLAIWFIASIFLMQPRETMIMMIQHDSDLSMKLSSENTCRAALFVYSSPLLVLLASNSWCSSTTRS